MLAKLKHTFFNKRFLTFCIIGGLAYLVHQFIYLIYTKGLDIWDDHNHLLSTAIAFSIASVVSYLLNAKFTYNQRTSKKKTVEAIVVFIFKFLITEGLTLGIMSLTRHFLDNTDILYKLIDIMLPLILTCITLVLQFLAFNVIFKENKEDKEKVINESEQVK